MSIPAFGSIRAPFSLHRTDSPRWAASGQDAMSLFPDEPDDLPPQAARLAPKLKALAGGGLYFGTSSWKYEGWIGSVYSEDRYKTRGKHSKKKFR